MAAWRGRTRACLLRAMQAAPDFLSRLGAELDLKWFDASSDLSWGRRLLSQAQSRAAEPRQVLTAKRYTLPFTPVSEVA